jgi:hypothetical protein
MLLEAHRIVSAATAAAAAISITATSLSVSIIAQPCCDALMTVYRILSFTNLL